MSYRYLRYRYSLHVSHVHIYHVYLYICTVYKVTVQVPVEVKNDVLHLYGVQVRNIRGTGRVQRYMYILHECKIFIYVCLCTCSSARYMCTRVVPVPERYVYPGTQVPVHTYYLYSTSKCFYNATVTSITLSCVPPI